MSETDPARIMKPSVEDERRREAAYVNKTLTIDHLIEQCQKFIRILENDGLEVDQDLQLLRAEILTLEELSRRAFSNISLLRQERASVFFRRFRKN